MTNKIKQMKILVVDDHDMMRDLLCDVLEEDGHEVIAASDGKIALNVYEKMVHEIDLVILDMIMPNMDGPEAFRYLKEKRPDIKVVFTSGYADTERQKKMEKHGSFVFLHKPFSKKSLDEAIVKAISF